MNEALIGIDVGGTYTDGVLFSDGAVVHSVKHRTDEDDLEGTLLLILDDLLAHRQAKDVKRIVLSTTLVTNLLATGRGERTALILLPGKGLPYSAYNISPDTYFLKGWIDFRGRQIEAPDPGEMEDALKKIHAFGYRTGRHRRKILEPQRHSRKGPEKNGRNPVSPHGCLHEQRDLGTP